MQAKEEGSTLKRESAEIYADFTISRIAPNIRAELTATQVAAIRRALVAQDQREKHSLDLRFRVPLYFRQYYFVVVGGRDRRSSTLAAEIGRLNRYPRSIRRTLFFAASGVLLLASFTVLFVLLYLTKSFMGIDIFSSFHLSDLLPFDLYGMAREFVQEWRGS